MSRIRVPLFKTSPVQSALIERDATIGGTFGTNIFDPSGKLVPWPLTAPGGTSTGLDTTDDLEQGQFNLYFTDEAARDAVGAILQNSDNVTLTYDDDGDNPGTITADLTDLADAGGGTLQKTAFDAKGRKTGTSDATTDDLEEGETNLYFTDPRVYAAVKAMLIEGTNITFTYDDTDMTITIDVSGGGGGGVWGTITGTLSDQIDLQAALDSKAGIETLDLPASEAISANAMMSIWFDGTNWSYRNAIAADDSKRADAFTKVSVASGATATGFLPGQIMSGLSGLVAGEVFLSESTAGGVTNIPPSAMGQMMQCLGSASSASSSSSNPRRESFGADMATVTTNTVFDHTSDAGFRAWGSELSASLQAAGLIQTADTGQVNWATVSKPPNASPVYEIYKLNDTQQSAVPVFFKIEYGTGSSSTIPQVWLTVGSGSNGSGVITGVSTTRTTVLQNLGIISTSTNYFSNICVVDGFVGVAIKRNSLTSVNGAGGFMICRSVDSGGIASADNITVYTGATTSAAPSASAISYSTNLVYAGGSAYCLIGFSVTNTLSSGSIQTYKHYTITPRMRPNPFLLSCVTSEINENTQFVATPVASASHNYISLGRVFGGASINGSLGVHNLCMVWE